MAGFLEKKQPDYEVIAISIYPEHLLVLDTIVNRLKMRGLRVSRSQILRMGIEHFDDKWLENADMASIAFRERHRGAR